MPSPLPHTPPPPPHYPQMPAFPGRPPISPSFASRPGENFSSRSGEGVLNPRGASDIGGSHGSSYNHIPQKSLDSGSSAASQFPQKGLDSPPMFPTNRSMDSTPYGPHRYLQDHHISPYSPYSTHHPFSHPGNYGPPHPGSFGPIPPSMGQCSLPSSLPQSSFNSSLSSASSTCNNLAYGGPGPASSSGSVVGLSSGVPQASQQQQQQQQAPPLEAFVQLLLAMNTDDQLKV
ncbi:hypothetical protein FHG87_024266, partial [Trinorchestia longiramus]